jgi:PhzF family phenazine biosynthesis protein
MEGETKLIDVYQINSFAKVAGGGNPAAVVLDADSFSEERMLLIAREIGFSETAFVMKSNKADIKIRYFTPVREVDLCGHATIAVFSLLRDLGILKKGHSKLETSNEILGIDISDDNVMMEMSKPRFYEFADPKEVADSLNIGVEDLVAEYLPQFVSTGLKDLIIPIRTKAILDTLNPDFDKIIELSDRYGAEGYHLFTLNDHKITAYTRNFAPTLGIMEESATGTASGALAAYLYKYDLMHKGELESVVFRQGEVLGRPSEINVKLEAENGEIIRIKVGGSIMDTKTVSLDI